MGNNAHLNKEGVILVHTNDAATTGKRKGKQRAKDVPMERHSVTDRRREPQERPADHQVPRPCAWKSAWQSRSFRWWRFQTRRSSHRPTSSLDKRKGKENQRTMPFRPPSLIDQTVNAGRDRRVGSQPNRSLRIYAQRAWRTSFLLSPHEARSQ